MAISGLKNHWGPEPSKAKDKKSKPKAKKAKAKK